MTELREPTAARCGWAKTGLSLDYHDTEWGVPVHDERRLFEFLVLEGAQAGLSWETILRKRAGYRKAFAKFDARAVARFDQRRQAELLRDPAIVRNRRKIAAAVVNARAYLRVVDECGSFDDFVWQFVGRAPVQNNWRNLADVPVRSRESIAMSAELRRHGFEFVGPTICYAFMQAVGMVNDHLVGCFRHAEIAAVGKGA